MKSFPLLSPTSWVLTTPGHTLACLVEPVSVVQQRCKRFAESHHVHLEPAEKTVNDVISNDSIDDDKLHCWCTERENPKITKSHDLILKSCVKPLVGF